MEKYQHITEMENVMSRQCEILNRLNQQIDELEAHREKYKALIEYYYSEQRTQDLDDDANHLIPETLHRGVLSEDAIYDLMGDYRDTAIRMLEFAVKMIQD